MGKDEEEAGKLSYRKWSACAKNVNEDNGCSTWIACLCRSVPHPHCFQIFLQFRFFHAHLFHHDDNDGDQVVLWLEKMNTIRSTIQLLFSSDTNCCHGQCHNHIKVTPVCPSSSSTSLITITLSLLSLSKSLQVHSPALSLSTFKQFYQAFHELSCYLYGLVFIVVIIEILFKYCHLYNDEDTKLLPQFMRLLDRPVSVQQGCINLSPQQLPETIVIKIFLIEELPSNKIIRDEWRSQAKQSPPYNSKICCLVSDSCCRGSPFICLMNLIYTIFFASIAAYQSESGDEINFLDRNIFSKFIISLWSGTLSKVKGHHSSSLYQGIRFYIGTSIWQMSFRFSSSCIFDLLSTWWEFWRLQWGWLDDYDMEINLFSKNYYFWR